MNSIPPTLSVLIPAFPCLGTLRRAVESVVGTEGTEVIIAPDDGFENYRPLVKEFSNRVTVLDPTYRLGSGATRNRAFAASRGDFITMLDCDDAFAPRALDEALVLARASRHQIAFIRTCYHHEASGTQCRELPSTGVVDLSSFINFHGSIHAVYHRNCWHPYSAHRISQDVLHDGKMLLKAGGAAPLTDAPYLLTLQPLSITANTSQDEFNEEYMAIIATESQIQIQQIYKEKLRIGKAYAELLNSGVNQSFHDFIRDRASTLGSF